MEHAGRISEQLGFKGLGRHDVVGRFDAAKTMSDGSMLALRKVVERGGMLPRFVQRFMDHRNPALIEHAIEELVAQRVLANACGFEDLNDRHASPTADFVAGVRARASGVGQVPSRSAEAEVRPAFGEISC